MSSTPNPAASDDRRLGQYEFKPVEEELVRNLGSIMILVGAISIGIGVLFGGIAVMQLMSGLLGHALSGLVQCLIMFLMGVWIRRSGRAFSRIAATRGHDMSNLMGALAELHQMFTLVRAMLVVALGLSVLAVFAAIILSVPKPI